MNNSIVLMIFAFGFVVGCIFTNRILDSEIDTVVDMVNENDGIFHDLITMMDEAVAAKNKYKGD